jgi:hypothetical protein
MEIRSVSQFLEHWTGVRGRTLRSAGCIPPERLQGSLRPGAFTQGDLVRHLVTIERYISAETVVGRSEHEIHHRGQLYLTLHLLEVPTPPFYDLLPDEARAASAGPNAG